MIGAARNAILTPRTVPSWSPAQITTSLWLDASDSGTITLSGSNVTQWRDKSGNSRHFAQSTGSKQPTTGTQNSLTTIVCTASQYLTATTSIYGSGNADFAFVAAYYSQVASNAYGTVFANYPGGGSFEVLCGGGGISYLTPWGLYIGGTIDIDSGSYSANQNWIISASRSSGAVTGHTNGTQKNTVNNSNSVAGSAWAINAATDGSEGGVNTYYEIICINAALGSTDRQKIEGYLAHKWGLTANLPTNHPYKTAAPTV